MNTEELTKWAIEVFWSAYTGLVKTPVVTKYGAGGRGEAVKKILTLKPSSELRRRIIDAIGAQMTHRRKLYEKCGSMQKYISETNKIKFYCNRNGATWLFQMGYEDEIPSLIAEHKEQQASLSNCSTVGCENKAIGGNITVCQSCECKTHDIYRDERRDYLCRHSLVMTEGETLHDYAMRCKDHTLSLKGKFLSRSSEVNK